MPPPGDGIFCQPKVYLYLRRGPYFFGDVKTRKSHSPVIGTQTVRTFVLPKAWNAPGTSTISGATIPKSRSGFAIKACKPPPCSRVATCSPPDLILLRPDPSNLSLGTYQVARRAHMAPSSHPSQIHQEKTGFPHPNGHSKKLNTLQNKQAPD